MLDISYITEVQVIYPQFNGSSFSSYDPIRNARFQLKIEIEIKPQSLDDGIVLYSGQNEDGSGDYVVVLMKDGYLEFRYNTGSGKCLGSLPCFNFCQYCNCSIGYIAANIYKYSRGGLVSSIKQ